MVSSHHEKKNHGCLPFQRHKYDTYLSNRNIEQFKLTVLAAVEYFLITRTQLIAPAKKRADFVAWYVYVFTSVSSRIDQADPCINNSCYMLYIHSDLQRYVSVALNLCLMFCMYVEFDCYKQLVLINQDQYHKLKHKY